MNRIQPCALAAAIVALLLAGPALAKEESKIQVQLENVSGGIDSDASGNLRSKLQGSEATLHLKVRNLDPNSEYDVTLDDVEQASFTTDSEGRANVRFDLAGDGPDPYLPTFDPRGRRVAVNDGSDDILAAIVSGEGEPDRSKVKEQTRLAYVGDAPEGDSRAHARYDVRPNGKRKFTVMLKHVDPGEYEVCVEDEPVGNIQTDADGVGRIDFNQKPDKGKAKGLSKKNSLDFDPRDEPVEIKQGDDVLFSGLMKAKIPGLNLCDTENHAFDFSRAAGQNEGSADGRVGREGDCDVFFQVTLQDVAVGDYDLLVDGDVVGTIQVSNTGGGNEGRIAFDHHPGVGEELLDFVLEPGQDIEIAQGGTTLFEATLP